MRKGSDAQHTHDQLAVLQDHVFGPHKALWQAYLDAPQRQVNFPPLNEDVMGYLGGDEEEEAEAGELPTDD